MNAPVKPSPVAEFERLEQLHAAANEAALHIAGTKPTLVPAPEPSTAELLDYDAGPQLCDACVRHDGGYHRGWCEDCAPDGVLIGMLCQGLEREACVVGRVRLSDGAYIASSGQRCCEDCATARKAARR